MTRPLVALFEDAARTFGHGSNAVVALHAATGAVRRGGRIAMMGRSGSGKSTLLHLLAGLDAPTTGTVTWPDLGPPSALRPGPVGIVFQAPSLIPSLDVAENVALPLVLMGRNGRDSRDATMHALDRLGIGDLATKLPEELSGGQSQRVAIARVLAHQPMFILADEPTGQLDHDTGREVIDALIEAADETDAALLVATHDAEVASRLAISWTIADGRLATERPVPEGPAPEEGALCSA